MIYLLTMLAETQLVTSSLDSSSCAGMSASSAMKATPPAGRNCLVSST